MQTNANPMASYFQQGSQPLNYPSQNYQGLSSSSYFPSFTNPMPMNSNLNSNLSVPENNQKNQFSQQQHSPLSMMQQPCQGYPPQQPFSFPQQPQQPQPYQMNQSFQYPPFQLPTNQQNMPYQINK